MKKLFRALRRIRIVPTATTPRLVCRDTFEPTFDVTVYDGKGNVVSRQKTKYWLATPLLALLFAGACDDPTNPQDHRFYAMITEVQINGEPVEVVASRVTIGEADTLSVDADVFNENDTSAGGPGWDIRWTPALDQDDDGLPYLTGSRVVGSLTLVATPRCACGSGYDSDLLTPDTLVVERR